MSKPKQIPSSAIRAASVLVFALLGGCLSRGPVPAQVAGGWRKEAMALYEAVKKGDTAETRRLILAGALPVARTNEATDHGNRATWFYEDIGGWYEIADKTALHWAAHRRDAETVRLLLDAGADPTERSSDGQTALHWASGFNPEDSDSVSAEQKEKAVAVVKALLAGGVDPKVRDKEDWLPLHYALLYSRNEALAKLLITDASGVDAEMPLDSFRATGEDARGGRGTPLHYAASGNVLDLMQLLLKLGADIRKTDADGATALHHACGGFSCYAGGASNDLACIRFLVAAGADVKAADRKGETPLHCLAGGGPHQETAALAAEAMKLLVAAGADINATTKTGKAAYTPFSFLFGEGFSSLDPACMGLMTAWMDAGASPNCLLEPDTFPGGCGLESNMRPLHRALLGGWTNCVMTLLEHGADVNARDEHWSTPLGWAVFRRNVAMARELVKRGADANGKTEYGRRAMYDWDDEIRKCAPLCSGGTPIHMACLLGDMPMLHLLLEANADVNAVNNHGWRPLHFAADAADDEMVSALLERGADADAEDNFGSTPLHRAVSRSDPASTRLLLDHGADMHAATVRESRHWLPCDWDKPRRVGTYISLSRALYYDNSDIVPAGVLPIHVAARWADGPSVRVLLDAKAEVNVRDAMGVTPLMLAAWWNTNSGVVSLLLDAGADADAEDRMGRTALLSCMDPACVRLLLARGADVNAQNREGNTALHIAARWRLQPCVEVLLAHGARFDIRNKKGETPMDLWPTLKEPTRKPVEK